jgi:hypothetical protein
MNTPSRHENHSNAHTKTHPKRHTSPTNTASPLTQTRSSSTETPPPPPNAATTSTTTPPTAQATATRPCHHKPRVPKTPSAHATCSRFVRLGCPRTTSTKNTRLPHRNRRHRPSTCTDNRNARPRTVSATCCHSVRSRHCCLRRPHWVAIHARTPPTRSGFRGQVAPARVLARAHTTDNLRQVQLAQRLGIAPSVAHTQQPLLGAPCRVEPRAYVLQAGDPALDFGTARGGVGVAGVL